jgi:hypothetical protein
MARHNQLLHQHLEGISWRVLEQYPDIIRRLIRTKSGVYALYRGRKLYYVGLADNLMGRIKGHLKDRHRGLWDRFSVYLTLDHGHMKELESLILRVVRPKGNKVTGGFTGSASQRSALNRMMREADADRRAAILGGHIAERRRRVKVARAKGPRALAGISDKSIRLKGKHGGRWLWGTLLRDGSIRYKRTKYPSPSAAAGAAVKGPCNGWTFWHLRDDAGRWVPLKSLRKR